MMMDKSLTSLGLARRVVLVTGSASGIGLATAQLFARAGARVVACDRDELGLAATVALLPGAGHWAERVDLGQTLEVEAMVARILTIAGRLDVLINAEVQSDAAMAVLSDEAAWSTLIDTHLKSRYFICRVAGEAMMGDTRGSSGDVISPMYKSMNAAMSALRRKGPAPFSMYDSVPMRQSVTG